MTSRADRADILRGRQLPAQCAWTRHAQSPCNRSQAIGAGPGFFGRRGIELTSANYKRTSPRAAIAGNADEAEIIGYARFVCRISTLRISTRGFSGVLDLPEPTPSAAFIIGAFPAPVKFFFLNVVPDHSLSAFFSPDNGSTGQDHFSIFKTSCEIKVGAVIVHPGLAPEFTLRVINRNTDAMQV